MEWLKKLTGKLITDEENRRRINEEILVNK